MAALRFTRNRFTATFLALATGTLATLLVGVAPLHAATYALDTANSKLMFKVKHMTISTVTGRFDDFDGTFDFDPQTRKLSSVSATIQMSSVNTGTERRDADLRSDNFFDVENYPVATFKSTDISSIDKKGKLTIKGDLTIRGITKPVVLDAELGGEVKDSRGNSRVAFAATGEIDRMDYGVSWDNVLETGGLVVSHEVDIILEIEGVTKTLQ